MSLFQWQSAVSRYPCSPNFESEPPIQNSKEITQNGE